MIGSCRNHEETLLAKAGGTSEDVIDWFEEFSVSANSTI